MPALPGWLESTEYGELKLSDAENAGFNVSCMRPATAKPWRGSTPRRVQSNGRERRELLMTDAATDFSAVVEVWSLTEYSGSVPVK